MRKIRWLGLTLCGVIAIGAIAHAQQAQQRQQPQQQPQPQQQQGAQQRPSREAPAQQRGIEPQADQVLRRMSAALQRAESFRVNTEFSLEAVLRNGQKIDFVGNSNVAVRRPNHLRADRRGEQSDLSFYYDGRALTIYGRGTNLYATTEAPPDMDAAIDYAREELDLEAPGADMLYSDPYRILTEDTQSMSYLGQAVIDGVRCHHIASRGRSVDWQLWVEDTPRSLPRRYVIVTKDVRGEPEFTVSFSDWEIGAEIPNDYFAFRPPAGSHQIQFLRAREAGRQARAETTRRAARGEGR